ncbi:MAG TPA: 50S ribosomal protein L10 [Planctomycetota bacterium]|nr:50S ribosomal protein L10 [Planctomycetota bacterium]
MARQLKQLIVDELTRRTERLEHCVIVNFTGLSAETAADVRRRLREAGITLHVVKNSLMARALTHAGLDRLAGTLTGPCALVTGAPDVVQLAKDLTRLTGATRGLAVAWGYGEGRLLTADDVRSFATMASRPQLVARLLQVAQTPLTGFVGVLGTLVRNFVGVLDAIARQQPPDSKSQVPDADPAVAANTAMAESAPQIPGPESPLDGARGPEPVEGQTPDANHPSPTGGTEE